MNPPDKEPILKRQVRHDYRNNQPRQYMPYGKRNWRYNRVWRKDMVWKNQNLATIPDSVTSPKSGQVNAVGEKVKAVNNVPAKKKTNDFLTIKMVQEKTSIVNSQVKTVVSPTTKTNAFLTTAVVQEKSSKTNNHVKTVVSPTTKTNASLTTAVVQEKSSKTNRQLKTVVSPTTNHVTPVQKEESRQEKTVHGFGEKNSVLDNRSKKRKRGTVVEIPSKKRLLEAIPSRSLQPLTNPRFLWNIEKEMEWLSELYEDLHL
ncbi:uncharacterized protein LOC144619669 isoform X2 [Crassostrea virginica]